jgi:hypothetical protein
MLLGNATGSPQMAAMGAAVRGPIGFAVPRLLKMFGPMKATGAGRVG